MGPRLQLPDAGLRDQPRPAASEFGLVPAGCSVIATPGSIPCGTGQIDPDINRGYSVQYNVGVQHELLPAISVNAYWFYSKFYDLAQDRQYPSELLGLHAGGHRQPARRQRGHDVQRQRGGAEPVAEPRTYGRATIRGRTRRSRPASAPGCRGASGCFGGMATEQTHAADLRRQRMIRTGGCTVTTTPTACPG